MKQQMKKRVISCAAAAAGMLCAAMPMHASASSIEDVYDAMRRIGFTESMILEAKNQYETTEHDDEGMKINDNYYTYDIWADFVEVYEDDIWQKVANKFGVSVEEVKKIMAEKDAASDTDTQTAQEQPADFPEPPKPFINMTLEEKQEYVASLPESDRAAFLANLSVSERNSIIKQMSVEDQADLASGFISLGEQLGMHISLDQLDGNGIHYSVRNEDGTLIDVSTVGTTVDDTGWNTTVPVLLGTGMILFAAGGLLMLGKPVRKQEEQQNG